LTAEPAIEALGLAKRFGRTIALADLTLTVRRGEAFGFLGPNGAGKTTAVKLLLGLCRATSGAAEVLGAPLGDREARRALGYLPELFRYQDWLSAREVLGFHARLIGLPRSKRAAQINELLELVGLAARANDRVATFSKGMQQRLGLAVALLGEPALVFLDEPTSALDPVGRRDVREIVERLRARGTAVFLNSHLLTEVERVCDRVAFVDHGRVVAEGTIAEIVGGSRALRLRLESADENVRAILTRYGAFEAEPPWFTLRGVPESAVPRLVSELAAAGAAIHAVEPARTTLEDRFLALLSPDDADSHDRRADAS
jgi:ABC-2 type transport system ATP-binding protein